MQWHDKVVEPPGESRSETWFIYHLGRRLKALYADSSDEKDTPVKTLTWDYPTTGEIEEPSAEAVLKEMNGYTWPDRRQLEDVHEYKDDGSTAGGVWIYCGVFPKENDNKARSRIARRAGRAGDPSRLGLCVAVEPPHDLQPRRSRSRGPALVGKEKARLVGCRKAALARQRCHRFRAGKAPDYEPDWSKRPQGMEAIDGRSPFTMIADGKSSLFVPSGLKDGPLPTHYEPVESPVHNPFYGQQISPVAKQWRRPDNQYQPVGDPRFPYVLTTYRLTEHHSGGVTDALGRGDG